MNDPVNVKMLNHAIGEITRLAEMLYNLAEQLGPVKKSVESMERKLSPEFFQKVPAKTPPKQEQLPKEMRYAQIRKHWSEGITDFQLMADMMGVSLSTVRQRASEIGLGPGRGNHKKGKGGPLYGKKEKPEEPQPVREYMENGHKVRVFK